MKLIIAYLFFMSIAYSSTITCDVKLGPLKADNKVSDLLITLNINNNGNQKVSITEIDGVIAGITFKIWSLGKGVKLRTKGDASWRRAQAFALNDKVDLAPQNSLTYKIQLKSLLSQFPENDKVANEIVKQVLFLKEGEIFVSLNYSFRGKVKTVKTNVIDVASSLKD